jgi:type VI secretion system protein ImpG
MSKELLQYVESELTFISQMADEFAAKYPKVAGRLRLEDKEAPDPHVERLIQAFAMLTGRIRHKIDDEFPEIVESLLEILYPHYLRPVPSIAIAQFQFDPRQSRPTEPASVPAESVLHSRPAAGAVCTFRTCYPVTVWPMRVISASLGSVSAVGLTGAPPDAAAALRIRFDTLGELPFSALGIPFIRLFLNGEGSALNRLYEMLFVDVIGIQVRPLDRARHSLMQWLEPDCIKPVGFDLSEGLFPYSDRSFVGYRLLQEYFHFPQKFFFIDVAGLDAVDFNAFGSGMEVVILFRDSELREHLPSVAQAVKADMFQLGCTPIVNLFEAVADPIRLSHAVTEYRVIPDLHRQATTEVYSVDKVTSTAVYSEEPHVYEPFYSLQHTYRDGKPQCFWYAHRRPSMRKGDEGTEVYLSLVDLNFNTALPPLELVSARVTCTNRDFVSRLSWQKEWGEIEGEELPLVQARCLVKPRPTVRPPLRGGLQWRLISHLALNRLSIVQGGGLPALQEILRLYCFSEEEDVRKRILGLTGLGSEASVSRVVFDSGVAFCRGLDVEVEFDEEQFAGSGPYLLACVLERFFGLYSAINSYTRLTARSKQRKTAIKRWPPRIGEQRIL